MLHSKTLCWLQLSHSFRSRTHIKINELVTMTAHLVGCTGSYAAARIAASTARSTTIHRQNDVQRSQSRITLVVETRKIND
jgi:hypothetical protein